MSVATPTSIEQHRIDEYVKLGFTRYEADKLSQASIDLPGRGGSRPLDVRTVANVLNKGCTAKLAYRIYRP